MCGDMDLLCWSASCPLMSHKCLVLSSSWFVLSLSFFRSNHQLLPTTLSLLIGCFLAVPRANHGYSWLGKWQGKYKMIGKAGRVTHSRPVYLTVRFANA